MLEVFLIVAAWYVIGCVVIADACTKQLEVTRYTAVPLPVIFTAVVLCWPRVVYLMKKEAKA